MINDLNIQKESFIEEQLKNNIKDDLSKIKQDYQKNYTNYNNIYNLNNHLNDVKFAKNIISSNIIDLFTLEYFFFFRILLINSKSEKIIVLKILINCIEINKLFTNKYLDTMLPIVICKIFEDNKNSIFEERYHCLQFFRIWLKYSDINFPIIFPQALASISKTDDIFKIGCIEFLREMSIIRPDLCSTVGGFNILITSLLDENLPKNIYDKIIYSLIYIINTTNKRKYFNGYDDFYKIFSIFTKNDFSSVNNNEEMETNKRKEEIKEENKKLEIKLDLAINFIKKMIVTWPGYLLLMKDKLTFSPLFQSLNNDINIIIKKAILKLFKEILEIGYNILDNFNIIVSDDYDYIYINKIYLAYIIQGLAEINFNENILKFIENNENNELRDLSIKLIMKYNILFTKFSNKNNQSSLIGKDTNEKKIFDDDIIYNNNKKEYENNFKINEDIKINGHKEESKQIMNIRRKRMAFLDNLIYHLNCKDTSSLTLESLSIEIIIATHTMLNMKYIKKYESDYSILSCKKELFSKDKEILPLIKNSKVIELKEFQSWDWEQIDSILDIIKIRRDLVPELNKQKFFKKLLFSYSPSKNLILNQEYIVSNFYYGAIGIKLFKILAIQDDLFILDSPNEDYIFQKSNSWIKDVMQCLESLLDKIVPEDHPFTIKNICNTLTRNIFVFIGIISNSNQGDEYLNKQGFYLLLEKFIIKSNKYDYLLTIIIDNLNFNSRYVLSWLKKVINNGNNQINKYIFNHVRCLLIFGKEIIIDVQILLKALNPEFPDCNIIIISIIKILINKGKNLYNEIKEQNIFEKINQIDKSLLYILMRDPKIYEYLNDIIKKEVDNINIDEIVENYAKKINKSILEEFDNKDKNIIKYYLTINLSELKNKYNHFYEYFWIKQLPFSIILQTIDNNNKTTDYILINYMEYNEESHNIKITSQIQESQNIIIDQNISSIQIICFMGSIAISKNCNSTDSESNILNISINDILKGIKPYNNSKIFSIFQKDGLNLILKQKDINIYTLEKTYFLIKIKPDVIYGFKTPINLITELNNNQKGYEILLKINAVEKLFSYSNIKDENDIDKNSQKIISSFWILTKLLLKNEFGEKIEYKYNIIQRISRFFLSYDNYSIKGECLYLTTFASQNEKLRPIFNKFYVNYFFNTSIGYTMLKNLLYIDKSFVYENNKLDNDANLIEYGIKLNPISQEIYNNIINFANNITFKPSISKIEEMYRNNNQFFLDANLFAKIYSFLSKYSLKESTRRAIYFYFEKCISSSEIAFNCSIILKKLGDDLLTSHKLD